MHVARRFSLGGTSEIPFDLPVRPLVEQLFAESRRLVLFMPVGAAVRLLAPCLEHKYSDPAVVCVDDAGRFAVSLLSGHQGGADTLAQVVARVLCATAVVTSASNLTETLALDLLGQELGWRIEVGGEAMTRASAALLNGEPVGICQEAGESDWRLGEQDLPPNLTVFPTLEELVASPLSARLVISDRALSPLAAGLQGKQLIIYRPKTLAVGMGCRRGVPVEELDSLLVEAFQANGLSLLSMKCLATAQLKQDEPGLIELAAKYEVPLVTYPAEELNAVFEAENFPGSYSEDVSLEEGRSQTTSTPGGTPSGPTPRNRVHQLLGLWGVSEPAALLAAGSNELLAPRVKSARATVAVARLHFFSQQIYS